MVKLALILVCIYTHITCASEIPFIESNLHMSGNFGVASSPRIINNIDSEVIDMEVDGNVNYYSWEIGYRLNAFLSMDYSFFETGYYKGKSINENTRYKLRIVGRGAGLYIRLPIAFRNFKYIVEPTAYIGGGKVNIVDNPKFYNRSGSYYYGIGYGINIWLNKYLSFRFQAKIYNFSTYYKKKIQQEDFDFGLPSSVFVRTVGISIAY